MRLWRLCEKKHVRSALSGMGASRYPGRWNHRGTPMVYMATTPSLTALELLVNVDRDDAPNELRLVEYDIKISPRTISATELPRDWNVLPAPASTRDFGTAWAGHGKELALAVPSVTMPNRVELCVIMNPLHPGIKGVRRVSTALFSLDPRLLSP
jgi:RES domain-containing protein